MKRWLFIICIVALSVSHADAQNLVYNGSFEQGTTGWTYVVANGDYPVGGVTPDYFRSPVATSGTEGYWNPGNNPDGNNVLSVSENTYWTKQYWVYQEIATQPGMTYIFSAKFAGGAGPVSTGYNQEEGLLAYWDLGIYHGPYDIGQMSGGNRANSQAGYRWAACGNPGSINYGFGWTTVTTTFTVRPDQSGTSTIYLGWDAGAYTSIAKLRNIPFGAYFDAVELVSIPEPTSLLALSGGLAILGLFHKRR